jgi:hypothetical protein
MSGNLVISVALFAASERDVLRVQADGVTAMGRGSVCYPRPTTSVNGRFGELEDFCGIPQIGTAERRHRVRLSIGQLSNGIISQRSRSSPSQEDRHQGRRTVLPPVRLIQNPTGFSRQ